MSTLTITNPNTKEKFQYQLKGRGLEPLSEDHLKFNCDVGSYKSHLIKFQNKESHDIEYSVKFDMHGLSGSRNFVIKAGKTANYQIQISPTLGGVYAGCVTFTDQATQRYIWYSMELESKGQSNVQSFEISSVIRKEAFLEIPIKNPYNEHIEYHVKIQGQHISGPPIFRIQSRSTETYRLTYLPLSTDLLEGSVNFSNSKAGEILCKVSMSASEAKVQKIPLMIGEIGKSVETVIELTNPSNTVAVIESSLTNNENFEVIPPRFEIAPQTTYKAKVKYIPNELEVQNNSDLVFRSDKIGFWKFLVFGQGEIATDFEERILTAILKKEGSTVVTFQNPFKVNIIVNVTLEQEPVGEQEAFQLLLKKSKVPLSQGANIQIPISFYPAEINEYRCKLVIRLNEKIAWVYPIRVITEATIPQKELIFQTVCRKKVEKRYHVELPGISALNLDDKFEIELNQLRTTPLAVMSSWFKILPNSIELDTQGLQLSFMTQFHPFKPFKDTGVITVTRKKGGIWR